MESSSQSKTRWRIDGTLWPAVGLLVVAFLIFEYTGLDLAVQDKFYNFETQSWEVDGNSEAPRLWFYDGPKIVIILLGLCALALAVLPQKWRAKLPFVGIGRRHFWIAFLTIGTVPAVIGQLKASTNIFCPSDIERYGGEMPYVRVVESYPEDNYPERRGRCYPAGHASGGFALVGLLGLAMTRRGQRLGITLAMTFGWSMGLYQMMKGSHYLGHTVITMLIAWIGFLFWRRVFRVHRLE
jgi:membrane-associated PAP2 superfamily phosphatase